MVRYAGPFLLLGSIPLFFLTLGPAAPLTAVGMLLAASVGAELCSPRGAVLESGDHQFRYRLLLHFYIPAQLGVTIWAIMAAAHASAIGVLSLAVSVGVTTGVFGMLAAHEMVHRKSRGERLLGAAMLTGMIYRHFRIAHVFGHHRWAATPRDAATARLGESFYAFLPRTVAGQLREAYFIERRRCQVRGLTVLHNRLIHDVFVTTLLFALIDSFAGAPGLLFFSAQSVVAISVLEMFNFIAHYGLVRRAIGERQWEPLADRHSWNSSNVAANLLIFNMGRHAFHHQRPSASYESLKYLESAPELPAGYAASILLALIPPLWRRLMDPRVRALRMFAPQAGTLDVSKTSPVASYPR